MKHKISVILILVTHYILAPSEKTPLLSINNSSKNIEQAIHLLNTIGYKHEAQILDEEKYDSNKLKKTVKTYIQLFQQRVDFVKENYVTVDNKGNISICSKHRLEPIIILLESYIKS